MVKLEEIADTTLLQKPSGDTQSPVERVESKYKPLYKFNLPRHRQYHQQYADIYFLRLTKLKPAVEAVAREAWEDTMIGGEIARRVERVLDVRQGQLCWMVGTVYMDMPLKPSVLEDISKDRWIGNPITTGHYFQDDGSGTTIMLEDDSGRIRLVGSCLQDFFLVTGCIIAVLGTENVNGEFEVIDLKFADLPPQPERWALTKPPSKGGRKNEDIEMADSKPSKKIAIVSGLEFSGYDTSHAMDLNLLLEFLLGDALTPSTQATELSQISRLIIAGNSMGDSTHNPSTTAYSRNPHVPPKPHIKKYGYDSSSFNPLPSQLLDQFLSTLLPTMPVTLLPGILDPATASYPQQPIHSAMFPRARTFGPTPKPPPPPPPPGKEAEAAQQEMQEEKEPGWFDAVTNPWEGEIEGWRFLGTGGQNLDDICKYIDSEDRLGMMEAMCRWRCTAPTAPDTLWAYPFQEDEPFTMLECPHVYFIGCQPQFGTRVIEGPQGQTVRLILVPSFASTREIVLVDAETLEVSTVKISTF